MTNFQYLIDIFGIPSTLRTILLVLLINWGIGIAFVQYFYYKTRRLRYLSQEVKAKSLPFTNSPEKWNRLIHSLLSFFMIPRVLGFFLTTIISCTGVWFSLLGAGPKLPKWRRFLVRCFGKFAGRVGLFFGSYLWIRHKTDKLDYGHWLGEDWKKQQPVKRAPIIISNHRTWSDVLLFMTTDEFPSYVASIHIKNLPFFGYLAKAFGSFFVTRGDKNSRDSTVLFFSPHLGG